MFTQIGEKSTNPLYSVHILAQHKWVEIFFSFFSGQKCAGFSFVSNNNGNSPEILEEMLEMF
jgi:hypothetical protein